MTTKYRDTDSVMMEVRAHYKLFQEAIRNLSKQDDVNSMELLMLLTFLHASELYALSAYKTKTPEDQLDHAKISIESIYEIRRRSAP